MNKNMKNSVITVSKLSGHWSEKFNPISSDKKTCIAVKNYLFVFIKMSIDSLVFFIYH